MPKIEELCYVKKQNYEQAAQAILGCGMRELGGALATEWNLPEMATDGLLTREDNFTLATGVSLASELARVVALNWYGQSAADIIQRIARHKGKAQGEIEHILHLNAVNVNDVLLDRGYAAPARTLFLLADDSYCFPQFIFEDVAVVDTAQPEGKPASSVITDSRKAMVEKIKARKLAQEKTADKKFAVVKTPTALTATPIKAVPADQSQLIKPVTQKLDQEKRVNKKPSKSAPEKVKKPPVSKELAASIKVFQSMVVQARPAHDLIEFAVKMCLLCGVQRCVFMVSLPGKKLLAVRYTAQTDDDFAIKNFKIPVNKPHVFSLLMEKSRNLFLNSSNFGKYWKTIPEPVKLAIGVKSFFSVSIFVNNHAMGLMYADKLKGELTQAEFLQFQGVCRLLSKGIVQSAHNKKKG